ncbi:MAG: UxaA family hydrolase [Spirochaetales bacterium]|nr:UxaA family hydrolase [Spirochaetales bacterium]
MNFAGFERDSGAPGVRNHVLILPTVICAAETARSAANEARGAVFAANQLGCGQIGKDAEMTIRTLVGIGANPNVFGVVVVGLGCETARPAAVAEALRARGKPVELVVIQEEGGTARAADRAAAAARRMLKAAARQKRRLFPVSELTVALECGGSDPTSGLAANPAVGAASDRLVGEGGAVILSETTELIGAEQILARRAADPEVAAGILGLVRDMEAQVAHMGASLRGGNPSPGNIAAGLTTLEEKSLGCILKGGTTPPVEVLRYAGVPTRRGLVIMDSPGADVESLNGMAAGGAQVCLFTTGLGTPVGNPVMPVIKITGNPRTWARLRDNLDVFAGGILSGEETVESCGERIFAELLRVAGGAETRAENFGFAEFAIWRAGISV